MANAKLSLHWSYLCSAKLFSISREFDEGILLFLSKEYELCNVEHYENWWIYPYWHPCLYSVYSKSSLMWNACVSGFCSTSFTILCDFWLWNALKRFCGCFQKNDNEMNEVMKIIDDWWSVCWILVRIGTTIKTEFWHWHLKQKMRIY